MPHKHTSLFLKNPTREVIINDLDETLSIWIRLQEIGVEIKLTGDQFVIFTRELKNKINADPDLKAKWKQTKKGG